MSGDHNQYQKPTCNENLQVEAMKQAVDALALFASDESDEGQVAIAAHEALHQAIEQAEKPVGYLFDFEIDGELVKDWFVMREHAIEPTAQNIRPLYAASPQRNWVGLTDEEKQIILDKNTHPDGRGSYTTTLGIINDTEAKLKEKNAYGWQSVANPTEYLDELRGGADLCGND